MPVSQGSAGGLPGMNLKAWVLLTSAGVIVKGFNVSGVVKGAAGIYTISFAAAMSGTNYVGKFTGAEVSFPVSGGVVSTRNTGSAICTTGAMSAGGYADQNISGLWEFYE